MKRIIHKLLGLSGILLPSSAIAACGTYACDNVNLKTIHVEASGNIYVEIHEDTTSLNCTRVSGRYMTLRASDANADKIYAMLLSAQAAGKPIGRVRISEQTTDCRIAYVWQSS